jgi:excisionase family DNA binding protein
MSSRWLLQPFSLWGGPSRRPIVENPRHLAPSGDREDSSRHGSDTHVSLAVRMVHCRNACPRGRIQKYLGPAEWIVLETFFGGRNPADLDAGRRCLQAAECGRKKSRSMTIDIAGVPIESGRMAWKRRVLPATGLHGAVRWLGREPEGNRPMGIYRERDEDCVEPLLITAKKAARLLCISERYLYTLTKDRQISVVPVGRKRLYRIADIHRFIDERSDAATPASP